MAKIIINELDLYYETHGSGEPLMLIAGLGSDSQSWLPIITDLAKQHKLIIPDNRGTGRTTPQNVPITISKITDDCLALANYLHLDSFNIMGHSMGGFVALDFVVRYPQYISKLILAGTSTHLSARNKKLLLDFVYLLESGLEKEHWYRNLFYWMFTQKFFADYNALQKTIEEAIEYPYAQTKIALKNQVNALINYDFKYDLTKIDAKTLILYGEEDLLFPPKIYKKVLTKIPHSSFKLIKNAAHSIHMENPHDFYQSVIDFLNS